MVGCPATQTRRKPRRSACLARSPVARSASPAFPPAGTGARSSTDSGTPRGPKARPWRPAPFARSVSSTTCPNSARRPVLPEQIRLGPIRWADMTAEAEGEEGEGDALGLRLAADRLAHNRNAAVRLGHVLEAGREVKLAGAHVAVGTPVG